MTTSQDTRPKVRRPRAPKPTCGVCGWETFGGECVNLHLHWTVCPTCRSCVDYGQSCRACT
jgi:hypothetical protein